MAPSVCRADALPVKALLDGSAPPRLNLGFSPERRNWSSFAKAVQVAARVAPAFADPGHAAGRVGSAQGGEQRDARLASTLRDHLHRTVVEVARPAGEPELECPR